MNKKSLLFAVCLGVGLAAFGQTPSHPHYVLYPENGANDDFASKYQSWTPGQPFDENFADDEEFFISRVKPKQRFTYAPTQVDTEQSPERRFLWWVPMGQSSWNAVPTYFFNSEVFNMWSYIDHWGNWTAPVLRAPAAYLDICHKNGVTTSVVAAVAWGATVNANEPVPHGPNINALVQGGYEKFLKYLRYYGVDGIGFNSEFRMDGTMATGLQNLAANAHKYGDKYGVPFSYAWYGVTGNGGAMGSTWDSLNSGNSDWFWNRSVGDYVANYFFPNYNWQASHCQTSVSTANSLAGAGASWNVYMGMDMQGRDYANWTMLEGYDLSFGMWGAHNMNMLFESRGEMGSSGSTPQETYLTRSERFFTGGTQNPVNVPPIADKTYYSVNAAKNFHGISSFITARSVLQGDLAAEPFVTYFNLGNGYFFNVNGETTFNKEWYNVGIQDYMPTWRWWWTKDFMGRTEDQVPEAGLTATFTWDDAWFGGSCMRISGSTDGEYLQLFKTKYEMKTGDKLTIRYKMLAGNAAFDWAVATEQNIDGVSARIRTTSSEVALGEWQELTVEVGTGLRSLNVADQTLALIGLHFSEAENLDMLIGEISLVRKDAPTPKTPELRKDLTGYETGAKVFACNYQGADVKLVWTMGEAPADRPWENLYNSDVDTWYYKVYVQQEQGEPVMCTATTSWAAYVVGAPIDEEAGRLRVGVSAVSMDGKTESEIAWSDYMELPEPTVTEGVEVDKAVIKADEEFTVRYVDPNHEAGKRWAIRPANADDDSEPIVSQENSTSITTSLSELGLYDVALTFEKNGKDTTEFYRGMIQISGDEVGAIPQIQSVALNDGTEDVAAVEGEAVTYSYVGRNADGTVSRGLSLPSLAFGLTADQLNFDQTTPMTYACWFKANEFVMGQDGIVALMIRDPKDPWPANNWGFVWQTIQTSGAISTSVRMASNAGAAFTDKTFILEPNRWYHMCLVLDYDSNLGRTIRMYMNGKKMPGEVSESSLYQWKNSNYVMFGGYAANRAAFNGVIDEFQIYNRALSEEEALQTMYHKTEIPEGLIGYWDFETDPDEDGYIYSTGTDKTIKASILSTDSSEGGEGAQAFTPGLATFDAGVPFLPGSFEVKTLPNWGVDMKSATTSGETVTPTTGSIQVTYNAAGDYEATLTLRNSWGSDTMTFPFVKVTVGIEDDEAVGDNMVYPNPFENELYVNFAEAGSYGIDVYSLAGNLVSSQAVTAEGGDFYNVRVNAAPGAYLVKITDADGKVVKTVKVIKK